MEKGAERSRTFCLIDPFNVGAPRFFKNISRTVFLAFILFYLIKVNLDHMIVPLSLVLLYFSFNSVMTELLII